MVCLCMGCALGGAVLGFLVATLFRAMEDDENDAAPVKHARWIDIPECPEWDQKACSNCGDYFCCQLNFCPNCGAIMDGGDEDD